MAGQRCQTFAYLRSQAASLVSDRGRKRPSISPWLGCTVLAILSGCSRVDTVPMSGRVTLDGQPLKVGVLTLEPDDPSRGTSTGAAIENGEYSIAREKGPKRGVNYRVTISSIDRTGLQDWEVAKDKIPPRYNHQSELSTFVPPDASKVTQDFELISEKPKKR